MEDYFAKYLSDKKWHIVEEGFDPEKQNVNETLFALGNGYIGSRGILEEIPPGTRPGTFFTGIYGGSRALVPELINAPNPIDLRISVKGEKLDVTAMDVLSHKRTLNMHNGVLARHTIYSNARKKRFDYQSLRFFSRKNKHVAAMRIYLTSLDADATFTITNSIDTSIMNMGLITEGDKKHIDVVEVGKSGDSNYKCSKTFETGALLTYASQIVIDKDKKTYSIPDWTFKLRLKKGETVCLTNYLSFNTTLVTSREKTKKQVIKTVSQCAKKGFDRLLKEHSMVWGRKWKRALIEIEGDPEIERAVLFNIYHLLIAANEEFSDNSIGAKALTGEGYRGHIFWDLEIFCLPFFIYTFPTIARNMLMYRYHRINQAREIAENKGFKGTMFPWESAETGHETTPSWYKDSEGRIQRVMTGDQEHHITADIAFSILNYFKVTKDEDFLLNYGLEMILEIARFWASRVEYNSVERRYEIYHVIGPDEFHEDVNNNVYTNILVRRNLKSAVKLYKEFLKKYPKSVKGLKKKIDLRSHELDKWQNIASKIYVSPPNKRRIIEQFDGFLKRKELPLPEPNEWGLPTALKDIENMNDTQYVKQADVIMALFLFPALYPFDIKRKNYQFYEKRTLHHSSLSASIHSAVGSDVEMPKKAYQYFKAAAYSDIKNIYGNVDMGIHAASLGGTWQALVHGFAGIRFQIGALAINPRLPVKWKRLKLAIIYRGKPILVEISENRLSLYFSSKKKNDILKVMVYGEPYELVANKKVSFQKEEGE
jgi:kojibiose phosphorylase